MKTYILRDPNCVEPQKAQFLDSHSRQRPRAADSRSEWETQSRGSLHPERQADRVKYFWNNSRERLAPSSVSTTDFALPTGS